MTYRVGGFPPATEGLLERVADVVSVALANAHALATLRLEASNDGLTGLLNHRAFQQRLHEEYDRARRHGRPAALCMFDLDGFKAVNDTHGHAAGDRVLETVAAAFTAHRRAGDIHARVGGDEFAVIAPDTDAEGALVLAERLRAAATAALAELNLSRHPVGGGRGRAVRRDDARPLSSRRQRAVPTPSITAETRPSATCPASST